MLARAQLSKPGGPLLAGDLPAGALRTSLSKPLGERALLPLVEIRNRERLLDVLDSERKTVVRMRLQQPALGRRRLRARVHVVAVRGYDKAAAAGRRDAQSRARARADRRDADGRGGRRVRGASRR